MRKKKGRYTFTIDPEIYGYFKNLADKSKISISSVIEAFLRRAMEDGLNYDQRRLADLTVGELLDIIEERDRLTAIDAERDLSQDLYSE